MAILLNRRLYMVLVQFYYEYEENGYLSNYFKVILYIDSKEWNPVEHYYQVQKPIVAMMKALQARFSQHEDLYNGIYK